MRLLDYRFAGACKTGQADSAPCNSAPSVLNLGAGTAGLR